ncbi:MAG TPA: hypothetical protein VLA00_13605 [Xanthobacteraceae bacterium]|nr:hypothetical protein [Xanthobacteraceae bacterium]
MRRCLAFLAAVLVAAPLVPARAETMDAQAASGFVVGRTFSFNCFEGSSGTGRVQADGSVAGVIRLRGQGNARYVELPAGTLLVKGEAVCAKLKGVAFQPCFALDKTGASSFRGNLAGFERMWCEFNRGSTARAQLGARRKPVTAEVQAQN